MSITHKKLSKVIVRFKEVGKTPLEAIEAIKEEIPEFLNTPITYAGRLDPMAEGTLLLLVGDEVHKKDEYLKLDKVYKFEVLFGFSTDSYDLLGKVTDTEKGILTEKLLKEVTKKLEGEQRQEYPPYSSKKVGGKSLFKWAREARLHEIEIPTHIVSVQKLSFVELTTISAHDLKKTINRNINLVKGDFRQEEIKKLWDAYIKNENMDEFQIATFTLQCSSGTYVRAIVNNMGKLLKIPTTTFHILRESVGGYTTLV